MENQKEKDIEHEMEAGLAQWFIGIRVLKEACQNDGPKP